MAPASRIGGSERGSALFSILGAVLIFALVYLFFITMSRQAVDLENSEVKVAAVSATSCRFTRQTLDQSILTWSIGHPGETPTLARLAQAGFDIPTCPDNGEISLTDSRVRCSIHD